MLPDQTARRRSLRPLLSRLNYAEILLKDGGRGEGGGEGREGGVVIHARVCSRYVRALD